MCIILMAQRNVVQLRFERPVYSILNTHGEWTAIALAQTQIHHKHYNPNDSQWVVGWFIFFFSLHFGGNVKSHSFSNQISRCQHEFQNWHFLCHLHFVPNSSLPWPICTHRMRHTRLMSFVAKFMHTQNACKLSCLIFKWREMVWWLVQCPQCIHNEHFHFFFFVYSFH